ncbi:MAG: S-layer homology domain-containing protein [Clostridia bacterium]|nr:S-layer homology domain-containing protein [Clostridia bacterium]
MKKIALLLLALVLGATLLATVTSADDFKLYTPADMEAGELIKASQAEIIYGVDRDGTAYVRTDAMDGEYLNGILRTHFTPTDISLTEYPHIRVRYRSDSLSGLLDVTNRTKKGEGWGAPHPELIGDEKWHSIVIDMSKMTGGTGAGEPGEMGVNLVLKPFGTRNVLLPEPAYFDIAYIACFKSEADALAYNKEAEEEKVVEKVIPEKVVYGPNKLIDELAFTARGVDSEVKEDKDGTRYIHNVVKPGTYTSGRVRLDFAPFTISLTENRYIKVRYRTDSAQQKLDMSCNSTKGESWLSGNQPDLVRDSWQDVIVDMLDMVGGKGVPEIGETNITFQMKPFGSQNMTINAEYYIDIAYIACFTSREAAEKYTFDEKDDIASTILGTTLETASDELVEKYMNEIDAKIEEILNTPTEVTVTGTKYYVSADGDDSNDGKSMEKAWKTISRVNKAALKSGDGVFFRRGDSFRTEQSLIVSEGVTYSAYGYGKKPVIVCSIDASGADKWIPTDAPNVYRFDGEITGETNDVGNIVFDNGKAWGIQIQKTMQGNRLYIGRVYNGLEFLDTNGAAFKGYIDLNQNLEFYHDWSTKTLYLYSRDGNPGEIFKSIELVDKGHGISAGGNVAKDVIIDNIEVFGTGSHGIGFGGGSQNTVIQNCVFRFIGGSIQYTDGRNTRYGNAVESGGNINGFTIRNCYASQIYDCCWTVQSGGYQTFHDVKMYGNVSEFCNTGLEVWQKGGRTTKMQLYDNYTRFNGYGWSNQRPNKDGNFFYGASGELVSSVMRNNDVYNNVNLFASSTALKVASTGPDQYNFHDNVYIMEEGKKLGGLAADPMDGEGTLVNYSYDQRGISRATVTGFEPGSKFYIYKAEPYGNMYDLFEPIDRSKMFSDVASNFWGKQYVDYVTSNGLFQGVSNYEFAPNGSMTRAMATTVLMRMADGEAKNTALPYTDVAEGAWYTPGIAWAYENGVIASADKFRPDENITREELADMLYRYAGSEAAEAELDFTDADEITPEYADAIAFCVNSGIIGGYDDGSVRPKGGATRAEVSAMIFRFANLVNEK